MVGGKERKKILTTPISAEDLEGIHVGDIVYLNGSMTTCRDVAHRRLVEEHRGTSGGCKGCSDLPCRTDHPAA